MAGLGGPFGGLLGNSILQQIVLYNVVGALIGSALQPYLQALTNQLNSITPLVPLNPGELAEAVIRNVLTEGAAAQEATMSGLSADRFHVLTRLAGNAPDPTALAVAKRRELIDQGRYLEGIRQGRLRDEWAELVDQLAVQEPSPEAPLNALLQGQLPRGRALELYQRFGGDPEHFDWLFDSQGTAPTPTQALELANRGIIPWRGSGAGVTSYEQAFLEGPWRNKWLDAFQALGEYLPPPRTVTAMYREGSIDRATAAQLLAKQGLAPAMVEAYLSSGSTQKTQATKDLARSTIEDLYESRLVPKGEALDMLRSLGYDQDEAEFLLAVQDVRLAQRFLSSAVGRVHTLYVGHKLDRTAALRVLGELEIDQGNASDLLQIWDLERDANVQQLTAAQVAGAVRYNIMDVDTALGELEAMGYTPHDAWVYLSVALHGPANDSPPPDDGPGR